MPRSPTDIQDSGPAAGPYALPTGEGWQWADGVAEDLRQGMLALAVDPEQAGCLLQHLVERLQAANAGGEYPQVEATERRIRAACAARGERYEDYSDAVRLAILRLPVCLHEAFEDPVIGNDPTLLAVLAGHGRLLVARAKAMTLSAAVTKLSGTHA